MKKITLTIVITILTSQLYSQTPNANESEFPTEGNIPEGIWGTYILSNDSTDRTLRFGVSNDSYTKGEIEIDNNNTVSSNIRFKTTNTSGGAQQRMIIKDDGTVMIGKLNFATETMFPSEGNIPEGIWGNYILSNDSTDRTLRFGVSNDSYTKGEIEIDNNNTVSSNISFKTTNVGQGSAQQRMIIKDSGKVGIGTANPDSELTVKGKIHCEEVQVDLDVAPDYVFEKYYTGVSDLKEDYTMPTLEQVEAYTKENHHLPNVPSAAEIKEEGLHLKEMTNLLLQKIEELTLYTIEQEKRIKALETQITTQK